MEKALADIGHVLAPCAAGQTGTREPRFTIGRLRSTPISIEPCQTKVPIEVMEEAAAIVCVVGSRTDRAPSAVDIEDIWYLRTMVATGPRFILQADIDALDAIARRHGGQQWAATVLELIPDQPSVGLRSNVSEVAIADSGEGSASGRPDDAELPA